MAWAYLLVAGLFEWGWPVGLKLGLSDTGLRWGWIAFPMGTAYAVWTGIGAVGAFLLGLAFFGEAASTARFLFVGLIIMGIIGLKLSS